MIGQVEALTITRARRREIEAEIERLIALLDTADGDPDLEDDDPAGDPLDRGEAEDWRPDGFVLPRPIYAVDQSAGPINEPAAYRAYLQAMRA